LYKNKNKRNTQNDSKTDKEWEIYIQPN